ncbi:homeobox-leucine zipper protein PROTODERMAL FACTOR 2-like isoform X2 [Mercurialis annua]|uniref:homeobox-leucine zipper protein PROTODERMAL FACTOR 2-like isoform X2 n=1 Tax=Mercurialis annua TaxID=3986 RepID=UPI00215FA282|nr:homeobox-leucine zipper protein PROTODERMAL FACTOR 2-like isoform X2 [Mercurialis annua]
MISVVEGLASQDERMKIRGELGLGPKINSKDAHLMKMNGNVPCPTHTPPRSPANSSESGVDSLSSSNIPFTTNRASDLLMAVSLGAEENKTKITELANSSMEELIRMAFQGEPLWQRQFNSDIEILNEAEYIREFRAFDASLREIMKMIEVGDPQSFSNLDGNYDFTQRRNVLHQQDDQSDVLQTEASREIGFVNVNAASIVECLMDMNQWSLAFSKIVSRATLLGILSVGPVARNYDATLQVMRAEFHMPTPLVPVRECQFARYCKRLGFKTWGVVDVSLENLFPYPLVKFQRRPSGCLIQEMPNGHSKVTWVEHVEVDYSLVYRVFQPFVSSGFAFGAKRWIATLIQHYEGIATLMSEQKLSVDGETICQNGKRSLIMLAERMMRKFCEDLSASSNNFWMQFPMSGADDCKMMTKNIGANSGDPITTIAFTHSLWLAAPPIRVFDFLRHEDCRNKWDLLSRELEIQELTHIIKGQNQDNTISIIKTLSDPNHKEIMYLQESYSDPSGYYVVYAPFDLDSMETILNGGKPDDMNVLPSGFVIHPGKSVNDGDHEGANCLLTLSFHIVDDSSSKNTISAQSVDTIFKILRETSYMIQSAVSYDDS